MQAKDLLPTLSPDNIQQFLVNDLYAAVIGGVVGRELEFPVGYSALAGAGVYAGVGIYNSGPKLWTSAGDLTARALGGEGTPAEIFGNPFHGGIAGHTAKWGYDASKIDWEQFKAWWNEDKSKTGWTPVNSTKECTVQKLLQDPKTYFQKCYKGHQ